MVRNRRRQSRLSASPSSVSTIIERLEDLQLLAAFGNAWADPRSISISFPSENTPVGAAENNIRTTLDSVAPRLEWQTAILRAAQTWAENANLNIGLVSDSGDSFGAVGLSSNDPRFGEIRVGAFQQSGVLASAVANLPISGTWGGDILFDSSQNWAVANSNSQHAGTAASAASRTETVDLYTVALHEIGHALSLGDSASSSSAMTPIYVGPRDGLSDADIAGVRGIYGVRQDPFETAPNETAASATRLTFDSVAAAAARLQVPGSLKNSSDVDVYSFQTLPGHSSATVTLWAAGISLLDSEVEVRAKNGTRLDTQRAESIFRNNVRISLPSLTAGESYFVTVRKNNSTAFAVGDYRLDIDFRSPGLLRSITPAPHDADPYTVKRRMTNTDSATIIQALSSSLVDPESAANETPASAIALQTAPGFLKNTHFEAMASLSSPSDRDFFTITAPEVVGGVLSVDLTALGSNPVNAELFVMNSAGDRLAGRLIKGKDGSVQVQIQQPSAGETYLICVRPEPDAAVSTGNYVLTADFSTVAADMHTVLQGSVTQGQNQAVLLTSVKSQLFRLDLDAATGSDNQGLQLSLLDAATGKVTQTLGVIAGSSESMFVWLPAGEYYLVVSGISRESSSSSALGFALKVAVISDDEGPSTGENYYTPPEEEEASYYVEVPPPEFEPGTSIGEIKEDPWANNLLYQYMSEFVQLFY